MAPKLGGWSDFFAPARDLNSALPAVLRALEGERVSGGSAASFEALASAISSALAPSQTKPTRLLLAESALLAALDMQFPAEMEAPLRSDLVVRSVSSCVSSRWPLVAGLAVRCLCALAVASAAHHGTKEDRMEKQTWTRRVVPQLRTVLEAHPKSFQVQQLVAEGCCVLLLKGNVNLGGLSALWPLLWPLVVHPRQQVASAAGLALCRLTWLLRAGADPAGQAEGQVATAERAMETACTEVSSIFTTSVAPRLTDPATHIASLQIVRLLELLRALVLYSRSKPADTPARRDRREGDDALILLPQAKILGIIELLLTSLTRETAVASQVLRSTSTPTGQLVGKALDLLCAVFDVCGTAALMFSAQLRRWLELLTEWSPKTYVAHTRVVLGWVLSLERTAPAILLRRPLLQRLCRYSLEAMQHEIGLSDRPTSQSPTSQSARPRKRKAEAAQDAADFNQPLFPLACQTLARLVERGATLLEPQLVASICEQVVHTVWRGLLRSPAAVAGKELDMCLVYKQVCRSPEAAIGLLEVMRVLIEPQQLGSKPLAPSLLNAFAAIISTLQAVFERHAAHALQTTDPAPGVRGKLLELADAIRQDSVPRPAESKGISITWEAGSEPQEAEQGLESTQKVPEVEARVPMSEPPGLTAKSLEPDPAEPAEAGDVGAMDVESPEALTQEAQPPPETAREEPEAPPTDTLPDTFQDTVEEARMPEVTGGKEDTEAAATLPLRAEEEAPRSELGEEAFSTPLNAPAADFQTPQNSVEAQASFPEPEPALSPSGGAPPPASDAAQEMEVVSDEKLELFPTGGNDSPSPDLCMDSPSDEN